MARKTALSRSLSRSPASIAANCSSSSVRSSEHSSKYVALKSSRSLIEWFVQPFWAQMSVHDPVNDRDQFFRIERLDDPACAARRLALITLVLAGFSGEDENGQRI